MRLAPCPEWIILRLVGVASTVTLGILVLTPLAKKVDAGFSAAGASPDVVATCREILTIAKFDLVLLFTVVVDMIFKPDPSNWLLLLIMAVALLVAGLFWLAPVLSRKLAVAG